MPNTFLTYIILAISLPLLLGGCGEKEVVTEFRNGIMYIKDSDALYKGKDSVFYDNGQKKFEVNYKDGKAEGLNVEWYENGKKRMETNWKEGKLVEGSEKFWNSKGEEVDSLEEAEAE